MPTLPVEITLLFEALEDGSTFARALFFPEFTTLAATRARASSYITADCRRFFEALPPELIHRRARPPAVTVATAEVELSPPRRSTLWLAPVKLAFPYAWWRHGRAFVAYVPALGIESLATSADDLVEQVRRDVQLALARETPTSTLDQLARAARAKTLRVQTATISPKLLTPKQRAAQVTAPDEAVLPQVATDLTKLAMPAAHRVDAAIERLASTLAGPPAASVLLVGRSGVGKTALVHELVRRRAQLGFSATPFFATSGAQLVAGMSGFGMWQDRCVQVLREASRTRAILHLGNLLELAEVGRSVSNAQGIASFLRPHLARGEVVAIAECTPEQLIALERADPHLVGAFQQQTVDEPSPDDARAILEARGAGLLDARGLDALVRLHRRYATYSAWPGRPLRFLDGLATAGAGGEGDVVAAFSRETGLPLAMLDDACVMDAGETRAFFEARVLGQPAAVDLVTGMLATVKARLTRPGRPIASLLFIGPTGVGKTETARALAQFLFGDVTRMTRFDMSEFSDPVSAQRLVGITAQSEGLLTARVREQPFSVVLLDEFEKGDPSLLDLLLQVLGDGRLTDAGGRVADFSNAVVILTSNLGAESWMRGQAGFATGDDGARRAEAHFIEAVRAAVRPELFNRIDRVVPFMPLERETVRTLVTRELERVRLRDGMAFRRGSIDVAPEVVDHLVTHGYDARYGARPLKRALEREVLAPLADGLLRHPEGTAVRVAVTAAGDRVAVVVKARDDTVEEGLAPLALSGERASGLAGVRRDLQALKRSVLVTRLNNEIGVTQRSLNRALIRLGAAKKVKKGARKAPPVDAALARRLARLREARDALDALESAVVEQEDAVLLALYRRTPVTIERLAVQRELERLRAELHALLLRIVSLAHPSPDAIDLLIHGDDTVRVYRLAREYVTLCLADGIAVAMRAVRVTPKGLVQEAIEDPAAAVTRPSEGVVALFVRFSGPAVGIRLEREEGIHGFVSREGDRSAVAVTRVRGELTPWPGLARKGNIPDAGPRRRIYDEKQGTLEDTYTGLVCQWNALGIPHLIDRALVMSLEEVLKR
jgi:ATP-dependent Clp protease ATP-binding subunit ClpC